MKISVITVHRDDPAGLQRTWRSMATTLNSPDWEWILMDGATKPLAGTHREIMAKAIADADRFVSEPDSGPYDAMNKGTVLASGDWILYLNAGDELGCASDIATLEGLNDTDTGMLWGHCQEVYESGEVVTLNPRPPSLAWYGMPVNHQNILFRRMMLGEQPYRLDLPIAADYELVCRLLKAGAGVRRTGITIARFHRGGRSTRDFSATLIEEQRVRSEHFPIAALSGRLIRQFKKLNSRIASNAKLRRWWRKYL